MIGIVNATVDTITNGKIDCGTILIKNGKIHEAGKDVNIPEKCRIIDAEGMYVIPGLIDAHSHLGLWEQGVGEKGNDAVDFGPVQPHLRAVDGINPMDDGFREAIRGGVTSTCVLPGSMAVISGQCCVIKTHGIIVDEMIVKNPAGIKVAFGENPKGNDNFPVTRMGISALVREAFVSAHNYMNRGEMGSRDLRMESLIHVLHRRIPLMAHAHRADDIATAIRIAREFGINLVIQHGTEGYKIASYIARHKIPVVTGPTLTSPKKLETRDRTFENAVILSHHGVDVAIMSDHPFLPSEHLLEYARFSVKEGLSEDMALRALTVNPARILGVDDRLGSIEKGKDADIVILSDEVFTRNCRVEMVLINGTPVYSRKNTQLQVT